VRWRVARQSTCLDEHSHSQARAQAPLRGRDGASKREPRRRRRGPRRGRVHGAPRRHRGPRRRAPRLVHGHAPRAVRARDAAASLRHAADAVRDDVPPARRRVAATPRLRRGYSVETSRGDAAVATWIARGDESRRRRGCHEDSPWRPVAAPPRLPRLSVETSRGDAAAATRTFGRDARGAIQVRPGGRYERTLRTPRRRARALRRGRAPRARGRGTRLGRLGGGRRRGTRGRAVQRVRGHARAGRRPGGGGRRRLGRRGCRGADAA